jgi:sphingolipid delta-4 desaturase
MASWATNLSWGWFWLVTYAVSGTLNHTLSLANHELSHNMCFSSTLANQILGMFANFPTGVPSAMTFRKYHLEHHRFQGVDGVDMDIPTTAEVKLVQTSSIKKTIWLILQPLAYCLRPILMKPASAAGLEILNFCVQMTFNAFVIYFMGWKSFVYLFVGALLGMGLHPAAGHFIAEHYVFVKGQETYSYYGPMNYFNFNVGYHVEHHDFPRVPWSRLPQLKRIAAEYYERPHYTSYVSVLWRYITDPSIGPHSRVKRHFRGGDKDE